MATKNDANGNVVTFELDTSGTYVDKTMAFNISVTTNGTDTSDATATAADIIADKTAYVNDEKITGTLVTQNYYTGTSEPASTLGTDGDLYFQTSD